MLPIYEICVLLFVILPTALFLLKQLILPAWNDQPLLPMFNKNQTPEQRLKHMLLEKERLKLRLAALDEEHQASQLELEIEKKQRRLNQQLIEGATFDDTDETGLLSEDDSKRKERVR